MDHKGIREYQYVSIKCLLSASLSWERVKSLSLICGRADCDKCHDIMDWCLIDFKPNVLVRTERELINPRVLALVLKRWEKSIPYVVIRGSGRAPWYKSRTKHVFRIVISSLKRSTPRFLNKGLVDVLGLAKEIDRKALFCRTEILLIARLVCCPQTWEQ